MSLGLKDGVDGELRPFVLEAQGDEVWFEFPTPGGPPGARSRFKFDSEEARAIGGAFLRVAGAARRPPAD